MKRFFLLPVLCLVFAGCSFLTRPTVSTELRPVVVAATNAVPGIDVRPVVVTNTVAGTPVVVTNLVPFVVTNLVPYAVTNLVPFVVTNYAPNPALEQFLATAKTANGMLNPTPTAPVVNWGIDILAGIAAVVAGWQTRKANQQTDAAKTLGDSLATVVRAVDTLPLPSATLRTIKDHIETVSALSGTKTALAAQVDALTAVLKVSPSSPA